jgi:diguanylate cyclase (GGDEF)-like protein
VCALLASLLANAGYAVESVVLGRDTTLALFDLGWVLFPVLLGAAALHPSMAVLSEPAPDSERRLGRGRLMLLASASLLAPGTQLLQVALGREINAVAIGLGSAVLFVLVLLRVAGLLERVRSQAVQLAALARDDALTGLPNRRTWDFELTRAFAQAGAQGDTLAVGLLDLDHFKAYNDSHGHQAGDRLLTAASAAWRALLPPGVVLARYGGDEFGLLLPGHDLAAAAGVLDQLVAAVPDGQTLSVGVAGWDDEEDPAALVARADVALYRAKRDGRDRVAVDRGPGRAAAGRVPAPRGETVEPFSDVTST